MKRFISILLTAVSVNVLAADFRPYDGPMPLAVFVQTEPWAMVLGADTPRVVVYEDGAVIFLKVSGDKTNSYSIFLDGTLRPQLQKFLRTRSEKGAVEIGGRKWAVAYRGVFPSEPRWSRLLRPAPDKAIPD